MDGDSLGLGRVAAHDLNVVGAHAEFLSQLLAATSLACPCSGGALALIFNDSPNQPTIWLREDPGTTFTLRWRIGQSAREGSSPHVLSPPQGFAFGG